MRSRRGQVVLMAGAFVMAACGSTPAPEVGTITVSTPSPQPPPQSSGGGEGECSNDYFPADEGSTWEYTSELGGAGAQERTLTITSTSEDGFTVAIGLAGGATFVIEWSCGNGDLTQLTPTASLYVSGGSSTVTNINHSGVTLPADLDAKPSWKESGEWSAGSGGTTITGGYSSSNTAVGTEVVTVPLGTFEAMRVEATAEGTLNGEATPPCQITQWWAKDTGLVRQETTCPVGGQSMMEVLELVSYDSP